MVKVFFILVISTIILNHLLLTLHDVPSYFISKNKEKKCQIDQEKENLTFFWNAICKYFTGSLLSENFSIVVMGDGVYLNYINHKFCDNMSPLMFMSNLKIITFYFYFIYLLFCGAGE